MNINTISMHGGVGGGVILQTPRGTTTAVATSNISLPLITSSHMYSNHICIARNKNIIGLKGITEQ